MLGAKSVSMVVVYITQVHIVCCLLEPMHVCELLTEAFLLLHSHISFSLQGMQTASLAAEKAATSFCAASSFVASQTLLAAHTSATLHCATLPLAALCQAWLPVPWLV